MPIKTIRGKEDLAINGAPPAFAQPLHVGRPNIGNRGAFISKVSEVLGNQWLTNNGPMVQEFEQRIAAQLSVKHCVAMCNGTIALEIAIRALELEGEVIVPSWTFVATAHALHWQGITPVFADIDPATHNLAPDAVRGMITPRTSGIIGVHLWGRAAPIDQLQTIAHDHGIHLLFDAAHAFGSKYKGQSIGNFGSCEVFSFHATKALNTMEGGAVTTNDDGLAEAMRLIRNFGFKGYDNVIHPGTNGKMIEVCAAMGLVNLDAFDGIVQANLRNHTAYKEALVGTPGISLLEYDPAEGNSHHYVVLEIEPQCPESRDRIIEALHAENILARRYFWPGAHHMEPYRSLFPHSGLVLPNTISTSRKVLVAPAGTDMSLAEIRTICDIIKTFVGAP